MDADAAPRPGLDEWRAGLAQTMAERLEPRFGPVALSLLSQATDVPDGTTVLLARDSARRPRAVVLCSSPAAPGMVERAMLRAAEAKSALGARLGDAILDPLAAGRALGLSFAALPYCTPLSDARPVWWVQRALLRPAIFDWLGRVVEATASTVAPSEVESRFAEPLRRLAASALPLSAPLRAAAEAALQRLREGAWVPRQVLMHGDFWKGNLLIRPAVAGEPWRRRFVVIDWPGSSLRGHAMLDLVRMAQSLKLNPGALSAEVDRHCRALGCERGDAVSHLAAALGHVSMHLEHFPPALYARMADACFATLARAGG